jgi:hypothetical protein
MCPLAERHPQQPWNNTHQMYNIGDIGQFIQTGPVKYMLSDTGQYDEKQQDNKNPIGTM